MPIFSTFICVIFQAAIVKYQRYFTLKYETICALIGNYSPFRLNCLDNCLFTKRDILKINSKLNLGNEIGTRFIIE